MACNLTTNKKEGKQLQLHADKQSNKQIFLNKSLSKTCFSSEKRKM